MELRRLIEEMRLAHERDIAAATNKAREAEDRAAEIEAEYGGLLKTASDFMKPPVKEKESALVLPRITAHMFELRPHFLGLITAHKFKENPSDPNECPLKHIKLFKSLCDIISSEDVSTDYIRMKAFPFSLGGRASTWLDNLPSGSITSWQALSDAFTNKYFPASKTKELRTELMGFAQGENETLAGARDRYKNLIYSCPKHGLPQYMLVETFYNSLDYKTKSRIDNFTNM